MPVTGLDIVKFALWKSGITGRGIPPSSTDTQDALADLNDMIDQWNTQRFLVWDMLNTGFTCDGRTTPYTVGPAGEYAMTPRPNRIYSAFVRQLQFVGSLQVDTPLKVLDAREEYDRINTKTLASFPMAVFLDTALPLGQLYVYPWPKPSGMYAVYITTKNCMPQITLQTDMSTFPGGYNAGFKFNLARRLRQAYGKGSRPDQELNKLADDSLTVIMEGNLQTPEVGMPPSLLQRGNGYNIFSDQWGN